jgi:hypothetical protein
MSRDRTAGAARRGHTGGMTVPVESRRDADSAAAGGGAAVYARLFGIDIRHEYSNDTGGRFGGIAVSPSPGTGRRLARYGLLARARRDGLDILFDEHRPQAPGPVLAGGPLHFVMKLEDPLFFNFTDLPTGYCSGRPALTFSSRLATGIGPSRVRLELTPELGQSSAPPYPPFGLIEIVPPQAPGCGVDFAAWTYEIGFAARPTVWRYIIAGRGGGFEPEPPFDPVRPEEEWFEREADRILPDGTRANCFGAVRPLKLQQRPETIFSLRGRSGGSRSRLLIGRLPVASAAAILPDPQPPPAPGGAAAVRSEIYVFV